MKLLKWTFLLGAFSLLLLASCTKEEIFIQEVETQKIIPTETMENGLLALSAGNSDGLELGCVSIPYPFSMATVEGETLEIGSEEDFLEALGNEEDPVIDFVYPLIVADEDGNIITVNDVEELADLFTDCFPGTGWGDEFEEWFVPAWKISFDNSCLQLVYPLTIIDLDSTAIGIADEAELTAYLADGNLYSFAFPLDLENEDGEVVTAETPDDLFDLLADCNPGGGFGGCGIGTFGCYELGYPLTVELFDGSTQVVNNDDEFAAVLLNGELAGFVFPMTLIDEDGNEIVVNDEEELYDALMACGGMGGGSGEGLEGIGCYLLDFPFTVELFDGSTQVINDADEFGAVVNSGEWAGFAYPLTLLYDGEEIVVNSQEELNEALSDCDTFGSTGDILCYNHVYPIQIENANTGEVYTVNNAQEWIALTTFPNFFPYTYIFPLDLENVETGEVITVEDGDEFSEALADCF
jgi:hypothetical protein